MQDKGNVTKQQLLDQIEDLQHKLAVLEGAKTRYQQIQSELEQRNHELAELNAIIGKITSNLSLENVLQSIVEVVSRLYPDARSATVQLLDKETKNLYTQASSAQIPPHHMQLVFPEGQGIVGVALKEHRTYNIPDVLTDPRYLPGPIPPEYRSLLVIPLVYHNQILGTLSVDSPQVNAFQQHDVQRLQGLAGYAAIAVQNARLYEQAERNAASKAALLKEVNHRVKNNLTAIVGLFYAEQRHLNNACTQIEAETTPENAAYCQEILDRLINRVQGLITVHHILSASNWAPLFLSDLVNEVINASLQAGPLYTHITTDITPSPILINAKQANSLALILNELVTNTQKHGLAGRDTAHITIKIKEETIPSNSRTARLRSNAATPLIGETWVCLEYRDDGPGYTPEILNHQWNNVGIYLINRLVHNSLRGTLTLHNDNGAVALIRFKTHDKVGG